MIDTLNGADALTDAQLDALTSPPAPPALDIVHAVASEEIAKGARVYVDVPGCPRVPTADGTIATVQRERRADGTLGEYLLTEIRVNTRDKSESAQRVSIARVQAMKDALDACGVTILR